MDGEKLIFRPIRKKKNEISVEEAKKLLHESRRGVLALHGDHGYPYAIPVNYLYDEEQERILFHGAKAGHKVDALRACNKVCFTIYGNERIKEEAWAPYLQSVLVFGKCHLVEDTETAMEILRQFARKYYPSEDLVNHEIEASGQAVQIFQIDIDHLSGKEIQEK